MTHRLDRRIDATVVKVEAAEEVGIEAVAEVEAAADAAADADTHVEPEAVPDERYTGQTPLESINLLRTPGMIESLPLCYLALVILRSPVSMGDLILWARGDDLLPASHGADANPWSNGADPPAAAAASGSGSADSTRLPFFGASRALPADMRLRLPTEYITALGVDTLEQGKHSDLYAADQLHNTVARLAISYHREFRVKLPPLNLHLLLLRYLLLLALPLDLITTVRRLAPLVGYTFQFPVRRRRYKHDYTDYPEIQLVALLVLAVKLHHPFPAQDGHDEQTSQAEKHTAPAPANYFKPQVNDTDDSSTDGADDLERIDETDLEPAVGTSSDDLGKDHNGISGDGKARKGTSIPTIDWQVWTDTVGKALQPREGRLDNSQAARVKESDVPDLSDAQLDDYLDWYQSRIVEYADAGQETGQRHSPDQSDADTFSAAGVESATARKIQARTKGQADFRQTMFSMFPLPHRSEVVRPQQSQSDTDDKMDDREVEIVRRRIRIVHRSMKLRQLPSSINRSRGNKGADDAFPFCTYRRQEELSGPALAFYQACARLSALSLSRLVRVVYHTERRLMNANLGASSRSNGESSLGGITIR